MTVGEMADHVARGDDAYRRQAHVILDDEQRLAGIVTRGDIVRALGAHGGRTATVRDAGETEVIVTYPDETLYDALGLLLRHDIGRLVVVDRDDSRRVLGYLGRREILAARRRHLAEEETRERGPLLGQPRPGQA
ncbi:MAG: CBS domain-containing protein [Opitutaceae bacterium]